MSKQNWFNVVAKEDSKVAIIRMFGYIGSYYPVNASSFATTLDQLNEKYERIKVLINSGGGDVAEGTAIFNLILNNEIPIDTYNYGIASGVSIVSADPFPQPSASPGTYGGDFACDAQGTCNAYSDPQAAGCPISFAQTDCQNVCSNPAYRCTQ